ncbi:MAG: hypothetical protein ACQEQC_09010, partial [Elusimicrobiota bacterium]
MKKFLSVILFLGIFFTVNSVNAQEIVIEPMDQIEITASPGYALPMWDYGYYSTIRNEKAGGLSLTARSYFGKFKYGKDYELDYGVEAGYIPLYKWDYTASSGYVSHKYSVIPILGQVRYRFGSPDENSYFYATTGLGFYHWRHAYEEPKWDSTNDEYFQYTNTDTRTTLGITAAYGYKMGLGDNLHGDAMIRWTSAYSVVNLSFGV